MRVCDGEKQKKKWKQVKSQPHSNFQYMFFIFFFFSKRSLERCTIQFNCLPVWAYLEFSFRIRKMTLRAHKREWIARDTHIHRCKYSSTLFKRLISRFDILFSSFAVCFVIFQTKTNRPFILMTAAPHFTHPRGRFSVQITSSNCFHVLRQNENASIFQTAKQNGMEWSERIKMNATFRSLRGVYLLVDLAFTYSSARMALQVLWKETGVLNIALILNGFTHKWYARARARKYHIELRKPNE